MGTKTIARMMLEMALGSGEWVAATTLHQMAKVNGVSWPTVKRVRQELPITVEKRSEHWYWKLDRQTAAPRPLSLNDTLGPLVH